MGKCLLSIRFLSICSVLHPSLPPFLPPFLPPSYHIEHLSRHDREPLPRQPASIDT